MMSKKFAPVLFLILSTFLLSACKHTSSPSSAGNGSVNLPPTITGTPALTTASDQTYSFTPIASDADNDPLTFSVSNLPSWASFNASTGTISGTPTANDTGVYRNISISVSDGINTTNLVAFDLTVSNGTPSSATLSWVPPMTYTDGTPVNLSDIAGFRVYYGTSLGNLNVIADLNNPNQQSFTFNNLVPGSNYFSISAYNSNGVESNLSAPVSINI